MAATNYWTSPFQVGSQHLARGFVRAGWDVAYVSNPISPLHVFARGSNEVRDRAAIYRAGGIEQFDGHLWAYVPGALATPTQSALLRGRWLHRNWSRLTIPNVDGVMGAHGFGDVDVLYFDTAVQHFWLDKIPHRRSVLRIADWSPGLRSHTREMLALEARLASRVDLVVYSAATLAPYVAELGARRSLHLPNGVDFERYVARTPEPPADLASIPRPIAIYVGSMEEWFDFGSVQAMAEALPDVSFVLIGTNRLARRRLRPLPNLYLLGRRPHEQIPSYLHHADVGLIPFDTAGHADLVHAVDPLKLYEYLACGLPVVAARWDELVALEAPVVLCGTVGEHVSAIRELLSVPHDPAPGIAFARRSDWQGRVDTLVCALFPPDGRVNLKRDEASLPPA